jgi:hypothetical protein
MDLGWSVICSVQGMYMYILQYFFVKDIYGFHGLIIGCTPTVR